MDPYTNAKIIKNVCYKSREFTKKEEMKLLKTKLNLFN